MSFSLSFGRSTRHVHQAECPVGIEQSGTDTEGITGARPGGQAAAREIRHLIRRMRSQVRLRGNELVRRAQLGNEEVRLNYCCTRNAYSVSPAAARTYCTPSSMY